MRQLLNKNFVELQFLWIVILVELKDEVCVEIEKNVYPIDSLLHYFQSPLSLYYSGFAEGLLQIVDDFYISLFGLLEGLALHWFHSAPRSYRINYIAL